MDEPRSPLSPNNSNSNGSIASNKEPTSPSLNSKCDFPENAALDNDAENQKQTTPLQQLSDQEDLSDVSEIDDSTDFGQEQIKLKNNSIHGDQNRDINNSNKESNEQQNQNDDAINGVEQEFGENKKENDEDALDFEAEEGECSDVKEKYDGKEECDEDADNKKIELSDLEEGEELEEGEVTDEDSKRAEESEQKPVCRFYTRGQCTWGISCRFLHPGVTDKGNYTMFDMVRSMPPAQSTPTFALAPFHEPPFRDARAHIIALQQHSYLTPHVRPPPGIPSSEPNSESAWERGLRTAKEMMRRANKRKEQDVDFDEKKMNLSLSQEEIEKDNYYTRDRASPEEPAKIPPPPYGPRYNAYSPTSRPHHQMPHYDEIDQFGRMPRHHYREQTRRHYADGAKHSKVRPTREVILQKADNWNDPWMRKKSPTKKNRRQSRSQSSDSSYSSSSSSQSGSSSDSSQSNSSQGKKYHTATTVKGHNERGMAHNKRQDIHSPPAIKRQYSPARRRDTTYLNNKRNENNTSVTSKKPITKGGFSRYGLSPLQKRKRSSTANSESSDSSASGSESDSSSSNSSSGSTPRTPPKASGRKHGNSASHATPTSETKSTQNSKKVNRREELLKQLKAVEDAIARKRSKLN